jgi:GTP-binding protein
MKFRSAQFAGASADAESFLGDGLPEVAFAGRSNVGKSSLLNRLLGAKLARTSSTPGRTQTVNWFRVEDRFWLVDLPGYGYAKVSRTAREAWAKTVASYLERPHDRRLVIQLVDAKVGATALDRDAAEYFGSLAVPCLVVATKIDRLKRGERARRLQEIRRDLGLATEDELLAVSADTGEGVRELWKRIADFLAAG